MPPVSKAWDGAQVRKWLASRLEAARQDQIVADKQGYSAQDDYDKAAAEEWVCQALRIAAGKDDQAVFADRLKHLLGQEDYPATGIYDDRRFERYVRANLRKLTKMAKTGEGFENTLRYQ
jgi:hypothetical protein